MSGAVSSATGSICTQVGPGQYCRTPYVLVPSGVINPATGQSEMKLEYGTPQYSSVPCGTGSQAGDTTPNPAPLVSSVCLGGNGASFPLADVTLGGYDPACGLYYGTVNSAEGSGCPRFWVWSASAEAASWTSVPPQRNSAALFDLYQFPLENGVPKWVAVGDGIFKSHDYGATWSKLQDWTTTPYNPFYASEEVLVGFLQKGSSCQIVSSIDDGATWTVAAEYPDTYLVADPQLCSPFAPILPSAPNGSTANQSNYNVASGFGYGVDTNNPSLCGMLVQTQNNTANWAWAFVALIVTPTGLNPQGLVNAMPVLGKFATNSLVAVSPTWGLSW